MTSPRTQDTAPGHTAGPWKVGPLRVIWSLRPERAIADVRLPRSDSYNPKTTEEAQANAALIAAAPLMYEALEAVREWCDLIEQDYPEMLFTKSVRAALAAAKGATS